MFADNTLTPREAVRLCALGLVAEGPLRYSDLAGGVRHFITRISGPSLDLLGSSIELLRHEGLVEALDGEGMEDNALLRLSEAGQQELQTLLTANMRAASDLSRLVTALKFRFLHMLPARAQAEQADLLLDVCETELARLCDLRTASQGESGFLDQWLQTEIALTEQRRAWLSDLTDRLSAAL
ncbi:MAG: hypothetical protein ACPGOY_14430 [Rhodospirillaceae bacterium]